MNTQALRLFENALEVEGSLRGEFLSEACGGDAELRLEVELMLADAGKADVFFGDPEGSTLGSGGSQSPLSEQLGDVIGPYKLLQKIGEGGFGVIWMAEQSEPIQRTVAVKVIKAGMDTRQVLARFEVERQALAMMDHPNIARVLDAGATANGRPYFAMELVKGVPITRFCDERKLNTRQRLELFRDVCSALGHAHQKGVIHRDLKPSNVLVSDGDPGVVKVIDFGIAKATQQRQSHKTLLTRIDQLVGTPAYMSPEQAALGSVDIDTRSDIYSLGALLYELLTGRPPFDPNALQSAGYNEMRRIIQEEDPPTPSRVLRTTVGAESFRLTKTHGADPERLSRLLSGDLDWIVMKAMEKDRTRRYETASALSAEILRFLHDEPVLAAAPGAGYRLRKFARRNKLALLVGTFGISVLLLATALSTRAAVRARNAETLASRRLAESEKARKDSEAISQFLASIFESPDPAHDGRSVTVVETLDRSAKKLEMDLAGQPDLKAKLQSTLGKTFIGLGLYEKAVDLHEKVRQYYQTNAGPEHPDTLLAMHTLAWTYFRAERFDEVIKLQEQVVPMFQKVLGPDSPETLIAMRNLAWFYEGYGRRPEAIKLQEEVFPKLRKALGIEHPDTLESMHWLAFSYSKADRLDKAIRLEETVLELRRKVLGRRHPDTLWALYHQARFYSQAGRTNEAITLHEQWLALSREVNGSEHRNTISPMGNLARLYFSVGRKKEALRLREEEVALSRKVNGPEHPQTLNAINWLAVSYLDDGRTNEALRLREEEVALSQKANGPEHPQTLYAISLLAVSYWDAGRTNEALRLREEEMALSRKVNGPEHPDTLNAISWLAFAYLKAGRTNEALKLHEEEVALSRKVNGPEHPETLNAISWLAISYLEAGRTNEALKLQEESFQLYRKLAGPNDPSTLGSMSRLATTYFEIGRLEDALHLLEEELKLRRTAEGSTNAETIGAMGRLMASYLKAERFNDGELLARECLMIQERLQPDDWFVFDSRSTLGACLLRQKRFVEAEPLLQSGYEGLLQREKAIPPSYRHQSIREALQYLVELYQETGDDQKAAKWREKLMELDQMARAARLTNK